MGVDVNCCRRPQNLGKKDLKTFRGINQKKNPKLPTSDFNEEEEGSFKVYNPKKQNNDNYFNSIYETNNNFKNYNAQPIPEQINSNYSPYPVVPNQEYISQPPIENTQYVNSYATMPQQNIISNTQYTEAYPTTQYIQSVPEYQPNTNNYVQALPNKYISAEPINNNYIAQEYSNIQSYENNNYNPGNNKKYSNIQTTEYINSNYNNYNNYQNEYNDNNSNSYYQNEKTYPVEYVVKTANQQADYFESNSNDIQYSDNSTNYYSNYETQPTYVEEQPQSYIPSNNIQSTNHFSYYTEPFQQVYSESQNIQEDIQYIESEPQIIKTKYICKPKKYIEKVQYIEPETQIQQIMYAPQKKKQKYIPKEEDDNENEDEDEDEDFNNFNKEYMKSKNRLQKYHDLEIENRVSNDEIKYKKRSNKYHEERRRNIKEEEIMTENDNQSESEMEEELRDGRFEKAKIDDVLVIKSTNIEKNKANTACQVPGFISNFLSKIF